MKLIFLDVDGTLTPPGALEPPQSALDAIRAARAAGNKVFLCSGRNVAMLAPLLPYGFDGYIASAGGYVVCGDKVLNDCPMTGEQSDRVLSLLKENGIYRTIEARDASYCDEGTAEFMGRADGGDRELERWWREMVEHLHVLPMHEYDGRPVYKVLFLCGDEEQIESVQKVLGAEFNFIVQEAFSKGCVNGEMINRKFDKGLGIRLVAEELGVPIADTVGFGDSMNDLEMIETAGVGVCMANGSEALKRACDMVCPSVAENGIAEAFRTLKLV